MGTKTHIQLCQRYLIQEGARSSDIIIMYIIQAYDIIGYMYNKSNQIPP